MGFGFSFGGSKSKSKSSPWAPQQPYITGGFERAEEALDAQQSSPYANVMGQYGQMLAPSLGQAQGFYQGAMDGTANPYASEQYNQMLGDYWNPAYQQAADSIRTDTVEGLRRSDWGDAMGASMAGMGVGIDSDPYVKARLRQSEDAMRGYQSSLSGLHMGAMGQAQQRADQFAGSQFQAANQMGSMGMQGVGLQAEQYNLPWQDLQNYWNIVGGTNWGGKQKGKDKSAGFGFNP